MTELAPGLYLVATPIGNLGDMTFRGLEVLKNVDIIGAEDTRHSRILLNYYEIKTPMISYHEHNAVKRREELLSMLREGKSIALISDAGTPGISDPGEDLVKAAAAGGLPFIPFPAAMLCYRLLLLRGFPVAGLCLRDFCLVPTKSAKHG